MSNSLDALGSNELFLSISATIWSQHFGATHIGPTLSPRMCRFYRPSGFWPRDPFSGSWGTGWASHRHPSAALSLELWMQLINWLHNTHNLIHRLHSRRASHSPERITSYHGLPNTQGTLSRHCIHCTRNCLPGLLFVCICATCTKAAKYNFLLTVISCTRTSSSELLKFFFSFFLPALQRICALILAFCCCFLCVASTHYGPFYGH